MQEEEAEKIEPKVIPEGKLKPFEECKEVQSKVSLQRQYIPKGAVKFKDVISGETETTTEE